MRARASQSKLALCFIAALTLAGLGSGTAGAATIKLIGSESKTGSFAAVSITKDAKRPHALYYKVTGTPAGLTVDVQALVHCTRGSKTKQKTLPQVKTTSSKRVKIPVTLSNPSICTISVAAVFHDGGGSKLTVKLYKS
ncbi:MAG: hypothetical protein QOD51_3172 [Candidatus Eremiobacteraeota bacterium]|jgi:hypothetical protein|nr:hypothetical protein [Candidatus Eremiobacteraeota bacterium]